jgi:O-antigen ligase
MCVAILLTGSRGGLLGLVSVGAFAALLSFMGRKNTNKDEAANSRIGLVLSGAALVLVTVGVALFVGGGDSLLRGVGAGELSGDISSGRLHFWPIALNLFLAQPIIGIGFDAFGVAFTQYDTWNGTFRVEQAHNDYLQILAEAGFMGLVCVSAFIYLLFRKGLALVTASHAFLREAAIGALAGCFGILVHSFFDFPLRTPSNAFFFLLLCAVATASVAGGRHRASH